jgi:hypothetical protein
MNLFLHSLFESRYVLIIGFLSATVGSSTFAFLSMILEGFKSRREARLLQDLIEKQYELERDGADPEEIEELIRELEEAQAQTRGGVFKGKML